MIWKIAKAGRDRTISFAAEELKKYLEKMDRTQEVAVLRFDEQDPAITDVLWLGVCPDVAGRVKEPEYDDAIEIRVVNGSGGILGSNPRSVLIGVYRFLRELGCAFVRPGETGEIIPKRSLEGVKAEISEIPSYRHRAVCIEGAVSYDHVAHMIDWLPKVGMNGYFNQFNSPFTFYDRWYSHSGNEALGVHPLSPAEIRGIRDQSVEEIKKRGMMYHVAGHGWTCEPFGIPGESWEQQEYRITPEQRAVMAEVNGKRDLWGGIPLNTNLCYSNASVRKRIAEAVVDYCRKTPEVDFLQLWLADGTNNQCECPECAKKKPSDWYVTLLNEVDRQMTAAGLRQKVVFLIYVDLLWAPEQERLENPDRFVMMFAPITRTYSSSLADCERFDPEKLPSYQRNHLKFPGSVGENLAWLGKWQEMFRGDSFDFDYHFMWDHFKDPGYYRMAEVLFRDMQNLHQVGLNGMVSCQNQRVFFPTGLGMTAMAAALWDEKADFDRMAEKYFADAYGEAGPTVAEYMKTLSDAFDPVYLRREKPLQDPEAVKRFAEIPGILDRFAPVIAEQEASEDMPENRRLSWHYLAYHAEYCRLLSAVLVSFAAGDQEQTALRGEELFDWARRNEKELEAVFDVFEFFQTYRRQVLCLS